jgi:hypothetical protein
MKGMQIAAGFRRDLEAEVGSSLVHGGGNNPPVYAVKAFP